MDRLSLLLSSAIIWLAVSYFLFTGQQYFSTITLVMLFLVVPASAAVFVLCYKHSSSGKLVSDIKTDRMIVIFLAVVSVLVIFIALYDSTGPSVYSQIPVILLLVSCAIAVSVLGLYLIKRITKNMNGYTRWITVIVCSALIAGAAYGVMYGFRSVNWGGIDELAYNYYAGYLFVHGTNPYLASMQPILQQHNIYPTVQLNGTFEYAYDYPALSFIPYTFMPLLKITNFFTFILILIFLTVFMAYFIYYKSGFNRLVLIPIGTWFLVTYTLVGTANQYLAVAVLFLIAYVERKRPLVSGVLVGLAASIIQLVWFAIPFFLILIYRESGRDNLLKCIGATLLAFVVVNCYFFLLSPKIFIGNNFAIFGLSKLVFFGLNIMQFFVAHYVVPFWYSAMVSVVTLLVLFVLFYLYTDTLKPLIAVAPMMIFFLAWRNISIYGIPFIPVVVAIYYIEDTGRVSDILKSKMPIIYSLVALTVIFAVLAVVVHGPYAKMDSLEINTVTPIIYGQRGPQLNGQPTFTGPYGLGGLRVNVKNNMGNEQPVSFYIVSRDPNGYSYFLSSQYNYTLQPHSSDNFTLQYQLPLISNNTKLYIFVFSQYYITSEESQLNLKG